MRTGTTVIHDLHVAPGAAGLHFERADIVIHGVDQSGPSFEVRVFLNAPTANVSTGTTPENGYAGSVHVYGYGVWPDDVGKSESERAAAAASGIRAPIEKTLIATEPVRAALSKGPNLDVTLVPVFPGDPPRDVGQEFKFENVEVMIR